MKPLGVEMRVEDSHCLTISSLREVQWGGHECPPQQAPSLSARQVAARVNAIPTGEPAQACSSKAGAVTNWLGCRPFFEGFSQRTRHPGQALASDGHCLSLGTAWFPPLERGVTRSESH